MLLQCSEDSKSANVRRCKYRKYAVQMSLDGCLLVDPVSMAALHILQEERHPSKMGIGQSKEGFSLLSMLNGCVGVPGRRLMRLWFLRPIVDLQAC